MNVLRAWGGLLWRQVRARQLWGNEVYTQDSDLVAVLMHCGFYNHALAQPPPNAAEVCMHAHAWERDTSSLASCEGAILLCTVALYSV